MRRLAMIALLGCVSGDTSGLAAQSSTADSVTAKLQPFMFDGQVSLACLAETQVGEDSLFPVNVILADGPAPIVPTFRLVFTQSGRAQSGRSVTVSLRPLATGQSIGEGCPGRPLGVTLKTTPQHLATMELWLTAAAPLHFTVRGAAGAIIDTRRLDESSQTDVRLVPKPAP